MNEELILTELREIRAEISAIKSAMYETDGRPGVLSRLRLAESAIGSIKRLAWLVVSGLVTILMTVVACDFFHVKLPG